ncbi:WXG100 family type VII secretion target [Streptomyces sp. NPDC057950]|uniref:WXG100 family type VII secretion target n=1 Tax=Streptomyces sp. NPDC057950 TaxID=3346288 RepID=UPI0036EA541E
MAGLGADQRRHGDAFGARGGDPHDRRVASAAPGAAFGRPPPLAGFVLEAEPAAQIRQTQSDVSDTAVKLRSDIDQMNNHITKLAGSYEGEAANAWQRLQQEWNTATQGLDKVIHRRPSAGTRPGSRQLPARGAEERRHVGLTLRSPERRTPQSPQLLHRAGPASSTAPQADAFRIDPVPSTSARPSRTQPRSGCQCRPRLRA